MQSAPISTLGYYFSNGIVSYNDAQQLESVVANSTNHTAPDNGGIVNKCVVTTGQ